MTAAQILFRQRVLELAAKLRRLELTEPPDGTPAKLTKRLEGVSKAAGKLLRELKDCYHVEGQDLEKELFNFRLVQELQTGRFINLRGPSASESDDDQYPSSVIEALRLLQAAAEASRKIIKPKRGNSTGRSANQRLLDSFGKNFIWEYRRHFGKLPPMRKSGWVVDFYEEALNRLGLKKTDAEEALRGALERHKKYSSPT